MSMDRIARVSARNGSIADQLRRSAESIALGAGHSPGRKIYHYQLARGSAGECIAALTQLNRRKPSEMIALSRTSANMVSPMLTAPIDSHNPTVATPAFPAPCRPPHVARRSSPASPASFLVIVPFETSIPFRPPSFRDDRSHRMLIAFRGDRKPAANAAGRTAQPIALPTRRIGPPRNASRAGKRGGTT